MPGGRPRLPGTEQQRAQWQRARIRRNVRAHRQRQREIVQLGGEVGQSQSSHTVLEEQHPDVLATGNKDNASQIITNRILSNQGCSNLYLEWLSQHFPFQLSFGPTITDAFFTSSFGACAGELHATTKARIPLDMACGSWVRHMQSNIPAENMQRQILADSLLSAALHDIQKLRKEASFQTAVLEAHTKTVERVGHLVRCQLNGAQKLEPFSLAGSIMAFALAELVAHSSWERFAFHIRGAGAIFKAAGPTGLASDSSRIYFNGFRALALPFILIDRCSDFVCNPEWFGFCPPGARDDYNVRISAFMDIVYQVPPIMEQYDAEESEGCALAVNQLQRALNIRASLTSWKDSVYPENPWESMFSPIDHQAVHLSSFPTDCMANLLTAYCGAIIVINELCADIALKIYGPADPRPSQLVAEFAAEMLNWIRKTCWSLEMLSKAFPRNVGKLNCLFSLRACWQACKKLASWKIDVCAEAEWCRRLGSRFQTSGLPLFPGSVVQFA